LQEWWSGKCSLASSGVTVGNRKAHPFLPMLSWLYGQLAGVAYSHMAHHHTLSLLFGLSM